MNENENNVLKNIQICIFLKESYFASLLLKFLFLFLMVIINYISENCLILDFLTEIC